MSKKETKKQTRPSNGEGRIFYREDKGLWCACVQTGLMRKTIYAKSQEEILEKKKRLEGEVVNGTYTEPSKTTVEEYITHWLEEGCSNSIRPSTYMLYKGIIDKHIIPTIGKTTLNKVLPLQIQGLYNYQFDSILIGRLFKMRQATGDSRKLTCSLIRGYFFS